MSYTAYTGDFTEKILTVTQTWDQEPAGYDRTATAYLPDTPATSGKLPVIIDLHGFGGQSMKRWKDIGDQIIFVGADGYCPVGGKCSSNGKDPTATLCSELAKNVQKVTLVGSFNFGSSWHPFGGFT